MMVHLFGATSSPGNFALKQAGIDNEAPLCSQATHFVHNNFYVDDECTSLDCASDAIELLHNVRDMLKLATKFYLMT